MSPELDASHVSRRDILRYGGGLTVGLAGAAVGADLLAPVRLQAQEVTFPNKIWNITQRALRRSGQHASGA